jgi:hypothetical protein
MSRDMFEKPWNRGKALTVRMFTTQAEQLCFVVSVLTILIHLTSMIAREEYGVLLIVLFGGPRKRS